MLHEIVLLGSAIYIHKGNYIGTQFNKQLIQVQNNHVYQSDFNNFVLQILRLTRVCNIIINYILIYIALIG